MKKHKLILFLKASCRPRRKSQKTTYNFKIFSIIMHHIHSRGAQNSSKKFQNSPEKYENMREIFFLYVISCFKPFNQSVSILFPPLYLFRPFCFYLRSSLDVQNISPFYSFQKFCIFDCMEYFFFPFFLFCTKMYIYIRHYTTATENGALYDGGIQWMHRFLVEFVETRVEKKAKMNWSNVQRHTRK